MENRHTESQRCTECGQSCAPEQLRTIDGLKVCMGWLCGPVEPVQIYPIGVVVNENKRRVGGFGTTGGDVSTIVLYSGQERFMAGLAEETHLLIVWQFYRQRPLRTVFARGWDKKQVGPFASVGNCHEYS